MIRQCECCSKIYDSFEDYRNHDPLCNAAGFVNYYDEDTGMRNIVFYTPCKDSYYDKWFEFNYCPNCGRLMNAEHIVYR